MNEHSQRPRTSVFCHVVDLGANVVPIFLSLVDLLQKALTAPEVRAVKKKRPLTLLNGGSAGRSSGGWPPPGTGGAERSPMPSSAQLHFVTNKGVACVSGGGAACDGSHVDAEL